MKGKSSYEYSLGEIFSFVIDITVVEKQGLWKLFTYFA